MGTANVAVYWCLTVVIKTNIYWVLIHCRFVEEDALIQPLSDTKLESITFKFLQCIKLPSGSMSGAGVQFETRHAGKQNPDYFCRTACSSLQIHRLSFLRQQFIPSNGRQADSFTFKFTCSGAALAGLRRAELTGTFFLRHAAWSLFLMSSWGLTRQTFLTWINSGLVCLGCFKGVKLQIRCWWCSYVADCWISQSFQSQGSFVLTVFRLRRSIWRAS